MNKLEQREEFFKGSIAGIAGAIVKYAFNEFMQLLKVAKYDNNATAITVVMKSYEHNVIYWIFGFTTALIIGAFFGISIAFTYSFILSENRIYLKAIGIGIGIWIINFGFFSRVFYYPKDILLSLGDMVSMLLSLIIYAIVTVYVLGKLNYFKT